MKRELGFTLLELMVVVVIIAIIAMIALPVYTESVHKSHRSEAYQGLNELALREEKYRSDNATYGTCGQVLPTPDTCALYNGRTSYYTFAVSGNTGTVYSLTATPKGIQTGDRCGTYTYAMSSGTITKTAGSTNNCL